MFIVNNRKWFFLLSAVLVAGSVVLLGTLGLNLGTDFTGGTIMEVGYSGARPTASAVHETLAELGFKEASVQEAGESGYLLRLETINETEHDQLLAGLKAQVGADQLEEKRFSSVGPTLGRELARKGMISLAVVILLILLYIALVFRKVSQTGSPRHDGVNSWVYGFVSIVMMVHDAIIPTAAFALLGYYAGVEIDALFLTAFLTILGLSVNDKIVALDRIRENMLHVQSRGETFAETVGRSLRETLARSINTSLTVILVLGAIFFFGAASTKYFALAMMLGMIVATYSSVFVAAPLPVEWQKRGQK